MEADTNPPCHTYLLSRVPSALWEIVPKTGTEMKLPEVAIKK